MYPVVWSVRFPGNSPSGVAFPSAAAGTEEAADDAVVVVDMMTVDVHRDQVVVVVDVAILRKMVVGVVHLHDAVLEQDGVTVPVGKNQDAVLVNHCRVVAQAHSDLGVLQRMVQSRLSVVGVAADHPLASEDDDVDGDAKAVAVLLEGHP